MRRPAEQPQGFEKHANHQRVHAVAPVVPETVYQLADAGLGDDHGLNAAAQPFQRAMKDTESSPAEHVVLKEEPAEVEEADHLGREEGTER